MNKVLTFLGDTLDLTLKLLCGVLFLGWMCGYVHTYHLFGRFIIAIGF